MSESDIQQRLSQVETKVDLINPRRIIENEATTKEAMKAFHTLVEGMDKTILEKFQALEKAQDKREKSQDRRFNRRLGIMTLVLTAIGLVMKFTGSF